MDTLLCKKPVWQWTHRCVKNLSGNGHTDISKTYLAMGTAVCQKPIWRWTHTAMSKTYLAMDTLPCRKPIWQWTHTAMSKTYLAMDTLLCLIDTDFDTLPLSIPIWYWTLWCGPLPHGFSTRFFVSNSHGKVFSVRGTT